MPVHFFMGSLPPTNVFGSEVQGISLGTDGSKVAVLIVAAGHGASRNTSGMDLKVGHFRS
jgi:hypothetical protein